MIYPEINHYIKDLMNQFDQIDQTRKNVLYSIAEYIQRKVNNHQPIHLIYICTHNSRRSHFGQVWAHLAAEYYKVENVYTYSGGTEATAFNINAIEALKRVGFKIEKTEEVPNPKYLVQYDENKQSILCFSKVYHDSSNPTHDFAAIMTCSDAEENCPFISGADLRIATTYEDPKAYDHTDLCQQKYDERCKQIALEILYIFSQIK